MVNSGVFFKSIQKQTKNTNNNRFHSSAHHTASLNFRILSGFSWHLKMTPNSTHTASQTKRSKKSKRVRALQQSSRTNHISKHNSVFGPYVSQALKTSVSLLPNGFWCEWALRLKRPENVPRTKNTTASAILGIC